MKKLTAILLALMCAFALFGCSSGSNDTPAATEAPSAESAAPSASDEDLDGVRYVEDGGDMQLILEKDNTFKFGTEGNWETGEWKIENNGETLTLYRQLPDGSYGDCTIFDIVGTRLRISSENARDVDTEVPNTYYNRAN